MTRPLSAIVLTFGGICCGIAGAHLALGPGAIPGSLPVNATMDSEDRFYATLFFSFGVALIWTSRDLQKRKAVFGALLATFFAGGIARIISALAVGLPSTLFIVLGAVELVLPIVLWMLHHRIADHH